MILPEQSTQLAKCQKSTRKMNLFKLLDIQGVSYKLTTNIEGFI